jgi:thiol-disulfide isomerase/thioredoxin
MEKQSFIKSLKKKLTPGNLLSGVIILAFAVIIINPSAKALVIRGLMKVGLFQPDVTQPVAKASSTNLPALALQGTDGKILELNELKGKVVFINFWATWCPPCIAEMPSINQLQEKLKDNKEIVFLMVDADNDFSKSMPFLVKHHLNFKLYQAASAIPATLLDNSLPTTVIFDKNGEMVFRHEGGADYSNPKVSDYLVQLSNAR